MKLWMDVITEYVGKRTVYCLAFISCYFVFLCKELICHVVNGWFSCMMSLFFFPHSLNGLLAKTDVSAAFPLLVMMPVNGGLSSG